jgi:hypothetical protein
MSETGGGAEACPDTTAPGRPISELPTEIGCYVGVNGLWQAVPCDCDLWVDSRRASILSASFALSFSPARLAPSLDGDTDVEVVFPDPGATWFDAWRPQAARTGTFAVTHSNDDGTTTVRLGQSDVSLDPVPLAACESRRPRASVRGPWGTALQLDMRATLTDDSGKTVSTVTGGCEQPPYHPIFQDAEGGAAGSPH